MQMNPLMMMMLLGDDNSAIKSKADYTILCNTVTDATQKVKLSIDKGISIYYLVLN